MSSNLMRVWSDNMIITDDNGWFISGGLNMLFNMNLKTGECHFVADFPDSELSRFRMNQVQIKQGRYILCLPDRGKTVWLYDSLDEKLKELGFLNLDLKRLAIINEFIVNDSLFVVASEKKQIIEISWNGQLDFKYFDIFRHIELGNLGNESVLVKQKIYCVCDLSNEVCEFDVMTKKSKYYPVCGVKNGLTTICYDGSFFWLSGFDRELYVWDKTKMQTRILHEFPIEFGFYEIDDPGQVRVNNEKRAETSLFVKSIDGKDSLWFIPFQTNKILYVEKTDFSIHIFDLPGETEDSVSWRRDMNVKYVVEYFRNKNIVGLYSFKNNNIVEINIDKKKISYIIPFINEEDKAKIWSILFQESQMLSERDAEDLNLFLREAEMQKNNIKVINELIGNKIYEESRSMQ